MMVIEMKLHLSLIIVNMELVLAREQFLWPNQFLSWTATLIDSKCGVDFILIINYIAKLMHWKIAEETQIEVANGYTYGDAKANTK